MSVGMESAAVAIATTMGVGYCLALGFALLVAVARKGRG